MSNFAKLSLFYYKIDQITNSDKFVFCINVSNYFYHSRIEIHENLRELLLQKKGMKQTQQNKRIFTMFPDSGNILSSTGITL